MNICIVGHGVVGKAVQHGFTNNLTHLYVVDPQYDTYIDSLYDLFKPDIVFICVPTPTTKDGIDSSIIESVLKEISLREHKPIVVIKSTVTPDVCDKLSSIYSPIVYNPEFLTEANCINDFVNPKFILLGGETRNVLEVAEAYSQYSLCNPCPVYMVDEKTACLIKYTLNSFLATKVVFFNQMYDIYKKSGADITWENFIKIISNDDRIGDTHMNVPGKDGMRGFGGMCFPKDTKAIIHYAKTVGAPFSILEEVVDINYKLRDMK
jgi:UDPglucose 6-dehydrogenase